jgi:hypothetical protein
MVESASEATVSERGSKMRGTPTTRRAAHVFAAGLAAAVTSLCLATPARATDTNVAPGATLSLDGDVSLADGDTFTAGADAGGRCVIHGNGHGIGAADGWKGTLSIVNCDVDGLGTPGVDATDTVPADAGRAAVNLHVSGMAVIKLVGSTFSRSNRFTLNISEHVSVTFSGNTIQADSITPEFIDFASSQPAFWNTGDSDGTKVIQGNRILRGRIKLTSTSNWLVGGSMPGDGNIMFGVRTGIELENATATIVRGNYSRTDVAGPEWNQVKNLSIAIGKNNLIEHNVFSGRNWLAELDGNAELRYNLLLDNFERGWVLGWADNGSKVHHNLLVSTRENQNVPMAGFVIEEGDLTAPHTVEIFNNTFDGGGKCTRSMEAAVMLKGASVLASLRNNAFVNLRETGWTTPPGLVRAYDMGSTDHLLYADFNLFFTPDSAVKTNYAVTVPGKTLRVDPGFAFDDAPKGGAVDAQVDPLFEGIAGKVPRTFPFAEADLAAGTTTPCQILAYYRQAYAPGAGSPLIDAGDPADGPGTDIGAVGAGTPDAADLFGTLCDPADVGTPAADPTVFTCKEAALQPPGGGGQTPVQTPHGITCVCDVGAGTPDGRGALAVAALALVSLITRRRRRHVERA